MVNLVQVVNLNETELEEINQLLYSVETIVNEQRHWEIETVIQSEDLAAQGVIQAFISMIINNFENSLARFRIYPRFIKKMSNGEIRIHSSTRISPTENEDITWILNNPMKEFQKLVITGLNNTTVAVYEEPKQERIEIPRLNENWIRLMDAKMRVQMINKIYTYLTSNLGKNKAKQFFDDKEFFQEELDELFGFLEGIFKVVAYISIIGENVYGLKGVIFKKKDMYEIIFDNYKDVEALHSLANPEKMSEKEFLNLLSYQWRKRLEGTNVSIKLIVDETKNRLIYQVKEKKTKSKKQKQTEIKSKYVVGERLILRRRPLQMSSSSRGADTASSTCYFPSSASDSRHRKLRIGTNANMLLLTTELPVASSVSNTVS